MLRVSAVCLYNTNRTWKRTTEKRNEITLIEQQQQPHRTYINTQINKIPRTKGNTEAISSFIRLQFLRFDIHLSEQKHIFPFFFF